MGLAEAVIGPALQLNFSLCPLLPSSSPLQVLTPMELLHKYFAHWILLRVCYLENPNRDSHVEYLWILHSCSNYHYVSANKKSEREVEDKHWCFIDMTWKLHHFHSHTIGKTYSHTHLHERMLGNAASSWTAIYSTKTEILRCVLVDLLLCNKPPQNLVV